MRLRGHKLDLTPGTERKLSERASTGRCECGWEESCRSQKAVRQAYAQHLRSRAGKQTGSPPEEDEPYES